MNGQKTQPIKSYLKLEAFNQKYQMLLDANCIREYGDGITEC